MCRLLTCLCSNAILKMSILPASCLHSHPFACSHCPAHPTAVELISSVCLALHAGFHVNGTPLLDI